MLRPECALCNASNRSLSASKRKLRRNWPKCSSNVEIMSWGAMWFWIIARSPSTIAYASSTQWNARLSKDAAQNAYKVRLNSMKRSVHIYPSSAYIVARQSTGWMLSSMNRTIARAAIIVWSVGWPCKRARHRGSLTIALRHWLGIWPICWRARIT